MAKLKTVFINHYKTAIVSLSFALLILALAIRVLLIQPLNNHPLEAMQNLPDQDLAELEAEPYSHNNLILAFKQRNRLELPSLELEKFIIVCLWHNQRFSEFMTRAEAYLMVEKDPLIAYMLNRLLIQQRRGSENFSVSFWQQLKYYSHLNFYFFNLFTWMIILAAIFLMLYTLTVSLQSQQKADPIVCKKDFAVKIALPPPETDVLPETPANLIEKRDSSLDFKPDFSHFTARLPFSIAIATKHFRNLSSAAVQIEVNLVEKLAPETRTENLYPMQTLKNLQTFEQNLPEIFLENEQVNDIEEPQQIVQEPPKIVQVPPQIVQEPPRNKTIHAIDIAPIVIQQQFAPKSVSNPESVENRQAFETLSETLGLSDAKKIIVGVTQCSNISNQATFTATFGKFCGRQNIKTLLIDLDFADPQLNQLSDGPCIYSIKDYLKNKEMNEEYFVKSMINNVFLLHTGVSDENSLKLINQESFWNELLHEVKTKFNLVLLRLPEINSLAKLMLQNEQINYLVLTNESSTRAKYELLDAWIPLKHYNLKRFTAVKCLVSEDQ